MTCEIREELVHLYTTIKILEQTVAKQQLDIQELKEAMNCITHQKRNRHSESTPNLTALNTVVQEKSPRKLDRWVDGGYMEGLYVANGC
jgi:FtsZ-binding cell division protein ZapB